MSVSRFGLAIALTLLWLSSVNAAPVEESPRVFLGDQSGVALAQRSDPRVFETLDRLRRQADETGTARLIVGIRTAFAPEGKLPAATAARQRKEIAAMQNRVLDRITSLSRQPGSMKRFSTIPFMAIEADAFELEQLVNMTEVTSIEEDKPVPPTLGQSVPIVGGNAAWSSGYTGSGQVLAVLDTGVEGTHPFLSGKVVSEACYSTTYGPHGATSLCPGGVSESTAPGSAMPYAGSCPSGECDHGTHVAGIMVGKGGGVTGVGYSGVAEDASLIAIQVFSRFDDPTVCGSGAACVMSYTSDQIKGLERVYDLRNSHDIAAVNMSLGGGRYYDQPTCDAYNSATKSAIDSLRSVGIATVIASANDGYSDSMGAPGCLSSAVSVGATWDTDYFYGISCAGGTDYGGVDKVACFSNSADFLDLLAPGIWISSSIPGSRYKTMAGTSMAAPHVAGAWALLKQKDDTLPVTTALDLLKSTGFSVIDDRNGIVTPRIDVDLALADLTGVEVPVISIAEALDNAQLTPALGGDADWFSQVTTSLVCDDAAQSGAIGNYQSSYIETTMTGPGILSFYWKVSSELGYDYLRFYIDGNEQTGSISGETSWQQKSFNLGSGEHTLRWAYTKDYSVSSGSDAGWLDDVIFTSTPCTDTTNSVIGSGTVFSGKQACVASVSIATEVPVTVSSGADVVFKAPIITLGEGFTVQSGAQFKAGDSIDTTGY